VRAALACLAVAGLVAAFAADGTASHSRRSAQVDTNPCLGLKAAKLRCPDLQMREPYGLYIDRLTKAGHTLLRAGNAIDNAGAGPVELRGVRTGPRSMRAHQRIYTRRGGRIAVQTGARLQFKFAHQHRYWWKFHDAARFELWRVDDRGRLAHLVRVGPKVAYCLRDLERTRPRLSHSPRRRVYPACSNNANAGGVTLGTSPGWADVYPPAYPEQWIDVTGLRGCFAYVHIADPKDGVYESNEANNLAQVIVRLPFVAGRRRGGCKGYDLGRRFDPGPYGSDPY
jgi:hypothetical protein